MTDRELRARLIDVMNPGHPVPSGVLRAAGLDLSADLMRRISRSSREATSDADLLRSADEIARSMSAGRERAALALRQVVRGSDRRAPKDEDPTVRRERIARRLEGIDGHPLDAFLQGEGRP